MDMLCVLDELHFHPGYITRPELDSIIYIKFFLLLPVLFTVNRNEEIVMPSERSGKIKENYEWKVRMD